MKKIITVLLFTQACLCAIAQQNLGIRNSNYAGIQGSLLNPSSIAGSTLKFDVNLLSVGDVFDNTFLYTPKKSLSFFGIKKIIDGSIHEDLFLTRYTPQDANKLYQVTFSTEVLGPSFFIKVAKKHEIGLTISGRAYANINNIPGNMAQNAFVYFQEKDLWNTGLQDNSSRINSMGWLQYGLHYATVIYSDGRDELKAGISLNYLQGIFGAYTKNTHVNYTIGDTTNIHFTNTSIDYGRTNFEDYKNHDYTHGHGFGADIGFTYVHLREASTTGAGKHLDIQAGPENKDYVYRIGLSVIDLGSINYNRDASSYHLQANDADFTNWHASKFANNEQLDRTLSAVFYAGDSDRSQTADHFRMGLPAAISVQADWNVYGNFFANATLIKAFGHGDRPGVKRPDVYSLTPRYETRWFEVSLPVSAIYYGHWQTRAGIAVRAGYFFIGGDAPGSLFKINDLEGVDFYAGIHYFIPEKTKKK